MLDPKYGFIHSCPTNLGTGMRASVHVDLPGYTKEGLPALKARCEELAVQPRGTRGESGGQTGAEIFIQNFYDKRNIWNDEEFLQESPMTSPTSTGLATVRFSWSSA